MNAARGGPTVRYKTLFRVLLKALGVFLLVQGIADLFDVLFLFPALLMEGGGGLDLEGVLYLQAYGRTSLGGTLVMLVAGCYLFFGGKWVANLALPDNRLYCAECGYQLSSRDGPKCPECGAPTGDPTTQGTL